MADKRISQLIERVDIANNDVLPIVASGATTTNKVTISTIQDWMQENLDVGVTSVGITLGTSGTDVNVTGSPITTSGNITINIPTANATNRGLLSAADWSTFNAKQPAGNYVTIDTTQTITAHKTFTASGGQPSITINHSSGAGHALDITKAGNGEGIRVNKTSGSGNAVSVVGTLEATTIVRTGGTSSQFLKADGSVDSSTYVTTDTNQSITGFKSFANGFSLASAGGTNQPSTFKNIGTLHEGTASVNQIGFNSGNNIYFGKGLNNGGVITWNNAAVRYYALPDADGTIALTSQIPANPVGGTGTTNQIPKFSGTSTLTNSNILDNGTEVNVQSRLFVTSGGQQFVFTPNLGTTSNRIETTGSLPLEIVSGGNITFAAGGATPQITLASSGAVTFANRITINTPSDGIGVLLNGRTSDNFSSIRFGANTGGGQYNSINVSSSSFDIISIGNTPITFGTNTTGGGGTRMTIGGNGTITLAGALNGTSAVFSGNLGIGITPSAWNTAYKAIQFGTTGALFGESGDSANYFTSNAFIDSVGFKYITSDFATGYFQENGVHSFKTASISGTAGNPITWTTPLSIASTGAATFSGALNGTSASFTGGFELNTSGTGALGFFGANNTTDKYIRIRNSSGNFEMGTSSSEHYLLGNGGIPLKFYTSGSPRLEISSTGAATFSSSVTATNHFSTGGSTFATSSGQVGIGTSTFAGDEVLMVSMNGTTNTQAINVKDRNAAASSSTYMVFRKSDDTFQGNIRRAGTDNALYVGGNEYISFGTGGNTERMRITSGGNVGIGTNSPVTALHVERSNPTRGIIATIRNSAISGQTGSQVHFVQESVADWVIGQPAGTDAFAFWNNRFPSGDGTERMRITSGGDVLINKQTLSGGSVGVEFERNSSTRMTTDGNTVLLLNRLSSDGTIVDIRRSGTQVGTISVTTTATSYNTSSDYRLKENVKPVENALSVLTQLKPCTFNFIANEEQEVIGFIAHEVQEVIPQAVTGEKDAVRIEQVEVSPAELDEEGNIITEAVIEEKEVPVYQGIDHSKLVPLLVASIQELKAEIEALKSQING